jgi:hypothetical protein
VNQGLRPHPYSVVLILIVATIAVLGIAPDHGWPQIVLVALEGATLVAALYASKASRRRVELAAGLVTVILVAALIALFAAGAAAFSRTPVNNTAVHKGTRGQTAALVETTGNGSLVAIFATCGAVLALVGSLLGSLAAASRSSGIPFSNELRGRPRTNRPEPGQSAIQRAPQNDVAREQTTILPPTH